MDEDYSNLWGLENSGEKTLIRTVDHKEIFCYTYSQDAKNDPQKTSPAKFKEKNPGNKFYGYTFPSGKVATPEEPVTCSVTDEMVIMENTYYGEKEGVKTTAE